jgi:two-component system sensor histidine kinase VanS
MTGCCVLLYGLVVVFLPQVYHSALSQQFSADFDAIATQLTSQTPEELEAQLLAFATSNQASVSITDADQHTIYRINARHVRRSAPGEPGEATVVDVPESSLTRQYDFQGRTRTITATAQLTPVTQTSQMLTRLFPFALAIIALASWLGAWLLSRHFSKPLEDLSDAAKRIEDMDMSWSYDTRRTDEIGRLGRSLETMSVKLADTIDGLRQANEQLRRDVDRERERERQRIELFTSVSHELKTPLTVIKGELEAMIYGVGDYQDRDTYLNHALRTTNDMEGIVKNILTVARMGVSDYRLTLADVDVTSLLTRRCQALAGVAEDRRIDLVVDLADGVRLRGDAQLLDQAFGNIVLNAVMYSPSGAVVRVGLTEHRLTVDNSGVRIEPADLDQVFLPFFRADKSRSRNAGGSGLGLSIVKTVFDHHGIAHTLDNTDTGVRFVAEF